MATFSKEFLSGSTNGLGIKVAASATPGTTIHTAVSGATSKDEVWLYAVNEHTVGVLLTLEWGGTTMIDNTITVTIPAQMSAQLIIPGWVLNNGMVVRAFSGVANKIVLYGFVNRIAP